MIEPRPQQRVEPSPSAPNHVKISQPSGPGEQQTEHTWTVDEQGVVDEPSDHSAPSFDDELDPPDAP
jgi:hypothetical protein